MSGYPEDIRMKALTIMKEVGVRKTSTIDGSECL